jgi:mono/diheme cytochrome c family protein
LLLKSSALKQIILTVIITLVVFFAAFMIFIYSGTYDISQVTPHNAITKWIIETTKHQSINKRLKGIQVPPMNDSSMLVEGFGHYNEICITCHGGPGVDPEDLAKGLYPNPPKFYKSDDLPDTTEAFWIIKNGIKMTSMPAFGPTHSDEKIWAITDFLLNKLSKMSPDEYQLWIKKYSEKNSSLNQ